MNNHLDFLDHSAHDLDLTDPDDRARFRSRVAYRLRSTTVSAMREWVFASMKSHRMASRAVADAYIARHTEGISEATEVGE